jgi:hypothetical protein
MFAITFIKLVIILYYILYYVSYCKTSHYYILYKCLTTLCIILWDIIVVPVILIKKGGK